MRLAGLLGHLRRRTVFLGAAAVLLLASVVAWQAYTATTLRIDDAYITFSFSKNLATGHGPVYSHGVRVEGYSNFLWMVMVAGPLAIKPAMDPYVAARWLMVPFLALLGWAVYRLIRTRASAVWGWIGVLMIALNGDLVTAAMSGLETVPYAAFVAAGFALYARSVGGPSRAAPFLFLAAALTRIDGFIPFGFVLAWELVSSLVERRFQWRRYLIWALPPVVLYLTWFLWRWHYYGLPLPTTYYAKALLPVMLPSRGLEYAQEELTATSAWIVLPFLIPLLARRGRALALMLLAFVVGHVAYVIKVGGDWMPFGRFFIPALMLWYVLLVIGIAGVVSWAWRTGWLGRIAVPAASLSALALVAIRTDAHVVDNRVEGDKRGLIEYMVGHADRLVRAAKLMGSAVAPGERLVTDYAGVFAYFTDAAVIDMWGLCTAPIALRGNTDRVHPVYGRTCPSCYPELNPDFFHTEMPLVRSLDTFPVHRAVVDSVWQHETIGAYLDFDRDFVTGRVIDSRTGEAMWFVKRRRPGRRFLRTEPAPGIVVDFPFEPVTPG